MNFRSYILLLVILQSVGTAGESGSQLLFVPNHGQVQRSVHFLVKTRELVAYFMQGEIFFKMGRTQVRFQLLGANRLASIEGAGRIPGRANFMSGNRPQQWTLDVPVYGQVVYKEIYPGIDMVYTGAGHRLKSSFLVSPGADPSVIRFRYANRVHTRVDSAGALVLTSPDGTLREEAPEAFQEIAGRHRRVETHYEVHSDGSIGFELGEYNHSLGLIIDPLISYSTYFGGAGLDNATSVAVDGSGSVYVAGWTDSLNLPTVNSVRATPAGTDAFVAKFTPDGKTLVYCTYIGGNGQDQALGIAVDGSGNAYVTGSTASTDFPTVTAFQHSLAGAQDAFALKLNPLGNALVYSTYLGGKANDIGNAIAVDSSGSAYVTGSTSSVDFPVYNAYQSSSHALTEIFIVKLLPYGTGVAYSTYVGGRGDDRGRGIALDSTGCVYVTGSTTSPDFPTISAFQSAPGSAQQTFVLKLNSSGNVLIYSTYLGGSGGVAGSPEGGAGIAVDTAGNAYVAGTTSSFDFPLLNAVQSVHSGSAVDAFITKLNPSGNGLVYSTYLGGSSIDVATGIAVNSAGSAYVAGYTASTDFPSLNPAQTQNKGLYDGFLVQLAVDGQQLLQSMLIGGSGSDAVNALAIRAGEAYVVGQTQSGNFPAANAYQPFFAGGMDAFVAKISAPGARFVPIAPCRVVDTRWPTGPLGGPALAGNILRDFPISSGFCGIPSNAQAYSLNLTVVPSGRLGYVSLWPTGQPQPVVSTLNSVDGRVKANAALLSAGAGGAITLFATETTHVLIDINGYFVPPDIANGLVFYPISPCRILDTRLGVGPFGGPTLAGGVTRQLPMPSSACGLPSTSGAYVLNFTVVPKGVLGFVTAWRTGGAMPETSILNAYTGVATANAAIVPAGTNGAINIYATDNTDLVIDINGYFAPADIGGLSFYPTTPCRLVDTRTTVGPLGGPILNGTREFPLAAGKCQLPQSVTAYSLNATVVPQTTLGYLTFWPWGAAMPTVSTLNSVDGSIVANAAILTASAGSVAAFATQPTTLILDVNGYFAP